VTAFTPGVAQESVDPESVLNRERTTELLSHFVVIYPGLWLSRVLGVFAGFGEVGIGSLDQGILVAMSELSAYAAVCRLLRVVLLDCALLTILISVVFHE
jgi:hypothetical protein